MTSENWLQELPAHPIFKPISETAPSQPWGPQRKQRMACRGTDLIVAVGEELRITSLLEAKEVGSRGKTGGSAQLQYKNLRHPALKFPIQQLSVNPTGKLIAVAGTHLVVILRLPKPRQHQSLNQDLDCEGGLIGEDTYHSEYSKIAKIDWHPWGEDGKSLLVLTEDAVLREFDVQRDCDEPQQEVSFLTTAVPSRRKGHSKSSSATPKKRRGFGVPDEEAQSAVSFSIGQGLGDWGPMTVYGLMSNGDVWALCPFLPKRCSMSSSYVDALNIFLQYKANQLLAQPPSPTAQTSSDPSPRDIHIHRLTAQRRFADILASQIIAQKASGTAADLDGSGPTYTITLPKSKYLHDGKAVKRQGPFLFKPAPEELKLSAETGIKVEGIASDIVVLPGTAAHPGNDPKGKAKEQPASGSGIGVVAIAWKDGRVDVCLEVAKVEAIWDDEVQEHEVPSLAVYESIDLGLLPELKNAPGHSGSIESRYAVLVNDPPAILRDPFDNTTFFVHHALGVHRISLAPWINGLTAALNADEPEKLDQFWSSGIKSDNTWAVDTLGQDNVTPSRAVTATVVVTDVRIGTTLISMAASRNVVALDLVVPTTSEDPLMTRTTTDEKLSKPAYVSLLGQQAYTIRPEDFDQVLSNLQIRSLIPTGRADQPLQTISSEDLRAFGSITQKFAAAIKEIRSLSSQVEGRLDLQVQEVARQLKRVQEVIAHTRAVQGKQDRLVRQILPDVDASDNLGYIQQRCKQLVEKQQAMTERLGTAMQNMMDNAHPEISLQEKAWMEDLNEMQREIEGEGENDKSLKARVSSVKAELEDLASKAKTENEPASGKTSSREVGTSHLAKIESSLRQEHLSIDSMVTQLKTLSRQLGSMQVDDN